MERQKLDVHGHESRYQKWKERVLREKSIPGLSRSNSKILVNYIFDMEIGANVSRRSRKGQRSFVRLNSIRQRLSQLFQFLQDRKIPLGPPGSSLAISPGAPMLARQTKYETAKNAELALGAPRTELPLGSGNAQVSAGSKFWHVLSCRARGGRILTHLGLPPAGDKRVGGIGGALRFGATGTLRRLFSYG